MRCRGAELPSLRAGQPGSREAGRPLQHAMAFHQNILQQASTYVDDFLESFEAAPAELTRVLETVRSLDERQAAIMEEHDKLVAQCESAKGKDVERLRAEIAARQRLASGLATEKVGLTYQATTVAARSLQRLTEEMRVYERDLEENEEEKVPDTLSMDPKKRAAAEAAMKVMAPPAYTMGAGKKRARDPRRDGRLHKQDSLADPTGFEPGYPMMMQRHTSMAMEDPEMHVGRHLSIKYEDDWYNAQIQAYDPKTRKHTVLYLGFNQIENLELGVDITEDEYRWNEEM